KLMASTVANMPIPGGIHASGWFCKMRIFCASEIIFPHVGVGWGMPIPMKLKPDSAMIIVAIMSVALTIIGPMALGMKCLKMIRKSLAPIDWALRMNSCSRKDRNEPRTIRVSVGHVVMAIITTKIRMVIFSSNEIMVKANTRKGRAKTRSAILMI